MRDGPLHEGKPLPIPGKAVGDASTSAADQQAHRVVRLLFLRELGSKELLC
jgi:hypothetical protein